MRIGKMGIFSHKVKRNKLKAGDHIYTWRAAFTYSHHGIYIGEDKVVHFTPDPINSNNMTSSNSRLTISSSSLTYSTHDCTYLDCAWRHPNGGVVVSCLECFIGRGCLYLFNYSVSSFTFLTKLRGGTCTTAKPDPLEDTVHRANYLLRNGFGKYNVLHNNCEDFALYCKTGLVVLDQVGASGQVMQASSVLGAPLSALASYPLVMLGPSPLGVATLAAGVYYMGGRYATDIGVRTDVVKVEVKDLAFNIGWVQDNFIDKE